MTTYRDVTMAVIHENVVIKKLDPADLTLLTTKLINGVERVLSIIPHMPTQLIMHMGS